MGEQIDRLQEHFRAVGAEDETREAEDEILQDLSGRELIGATPRITDLIGYGIRARRAQESGSSGKDKEAGIDDKFHPTYHFG